MDQQQEEQEQQQELFAGRLCDFVDEQREEILREWENRVCTFLETARRLSEPALRDHLPKLLVWIRDVVRSARENRPAPVPGPLPVVHAQSRIRDGYDLTAVARELSFLRQVILELWGERTGSSIGVEDVLRFNDAIDIVMAESVQAFADAQQSEVRQHLDTERQMIGIVAHDLRGPLNTILLSSDALLQHPLNNPELRGVVRIRNAADGARRLVRDLLDFTRARLGTGIPVNRRPADLHVIVREVIDQERVHASEREILHIEESDGAAHLDPDRIAQLAHNLVSNAVKYGAIESLIAVRTRGEAESVILMVHNWGPPIPLDEQPHLLEPLRRGADRRRGDGVGLGLYIVDSIVRAHGGTVTVLSTEEQGTSFTIRLPRTPPSDSPPHPDQFP